MDYYHVQTGSDVKFAEGEEDEDSTAEQEKSEKETNEKNDEE